MLSFDHGREQSSLHVVSAWASEQGLVLGQRSVEDKSNEITVVLELLDQLALENSIVTLDAMGGAGRRFRPAQPDGRASGGCQSAIAERILARGGDYVLAVESIRSLNSAPTKVESEIRYFLSSCPDGPAVLGQAVRTHWAVENALHWVLDVTFREDDSRVRDQRAARNFAVLRKIALNLLSRDRSAKASARARRKKAAWNNRYMLQLLTE